jgi:hypothetical protein
MVEYWNIGRMVFGKMGEWFLRKAILTRHKANEKTVVILSLLRRFYIIPLFHVQGINSGSAKPLYSQ